MVSWLRCGFVSAEPEKRRRIEQYDHKNKKRADNPPVGLVTPDTDPDQDIESLKIVEVD